LEGFLEGSACKPSGVKKTMLTESARPKSWQSGREDKVIKIGFLIVHLASRKDLCKPLREFAGSNSGS
jgi:hypothetical protein